MSGPSSEITKAEATMSRFFTKADEKTRYRDILVFLDTEDYSILESLDPDYVVPNIRLALRSLGYFGYLTVMVVFNDEQKAEDFRIKYQNSAILINFVPKGGKSKRLYETYVTTLVWARIRVFHGKRANILFFSQNMEQDAKFKDVRDGLEKRGFNVSVASPDFILHFYEDPNLPCS